MKSMAWVNGMVLLASMSAAAAEQQSAPGVYSGYSEQLHGEYVRSSQYIAVRDGVKLAADIYRPAEAGVAVNKPYPVIWHHTNARTGGRGTGFPGSDLGKIKELAKFGYVIVQVDRRGLGASFGTRRGYEDLTEARDAFDITEWLAVQSWSDGNVGVYGCSNTGEAAMHTPQFMPPHLKAVFAGCYSFNRYDGFHRGGLLANWGTGPERTVQEDITQSAPVDGDDAKTLLKQAAEEHRLNTSMLEMWKGMPYRDSWSDLVASRFWLEGSVSTYRDQLARSNVAIYTQGGWYDDFRKEGLIAFANLKNKKKILIGPWEHCRNDGFDLLSEYRRFFDATLKNIDNGIFAEPPIRYFTVNAPAGREWRSATTWPLPNAKPTQFFLSPGKLATSVSKDGPTQIDYSVRYDLTCPANWPMLSQTCVQDDKGLVFTSAALNRDTEVTGHPLIDLWLKSTASDGNVFVYLEDVAEDGKTTIVTDGRLKASLRAVHKPPYDTLGTPWHRSLEEDALPLISGQAAQLRFDLLPISYVFKAGHRIRINVTGADHRERFKNSPPAPVISILTDSKHTSVVTLPVVTLEAPIALR